MRISERSAGWDVEDYLRLSVLSNCCRAVCVEEDDTLAVRVDR